MRAPREIASNIDLKNILTVNRQGKPLEAFLAKGDMNDPTHYLEAMKSENALKWKQAVRKELSNMEKYNVWSVVDSNHQVKPLQCTWIFKTKKDAENNVLECKARLCAQGFGKTEGIDYNATYSSTGKMASLRLLIVISLSLNLRFHQLDIKSAFLNAPLEEDIYLHPPPGVNIDSSKLLK